MAGERALAFAATADARQHFSAAAKSQDHFLEAKQGLAEVEFREGHEEEAVALFRTLADQSRDAGDRHGAARNLSRVAWALRNKEASEEVIRTLDEALGLLGDEEESREYVELLVQKGQILSLHFGRFSEAKPILQRAFGLARDRRDQALIAESSDGLAHVADGEGNASEALNYGDSAMKAATQSGVAELIGRTFNNHAVKLASFGNPEAGLEILSQGREYLLHAYGSAGVSALDVSRAWILWLMGLPGEVAHLTARGQAAWQRWRGYQRILEVWSAVEAGQAAQAESRITAAWNDLGGPAVREKFLASPQESRYEARQVLYAESLLLLHTGEADRAARIARAVVSFDRDSFGESFDVGQGLILLAMALLIAEDVSEWNQALERLESLLDPLDRYPYLRAHVHELRGLAAAAKDDSQIASREFETAVNLLERCANASDRARCLRRAAEALLRTDTEEARKRAVQYLRQGLTLTESAGSIAEKNRIESSLRALGIRPRAGRPRRTDPSALTPREAEVAVLVAAGTTNAKIADELFLSERTVQDHISNALRKLGLSGRAGLASWAARQGLV
jgi:DNA-binding NarL/FixJ family response regulator